MSDLIVFQGFSDILLEVLIALAPLVALFAFFQVVYLKMSRPQVINILKGLFLAFWGLAFFLQGVYIGFLPAGEKMGAVLGGLSYNWVVIPVGFILGFVATFAEPAVRVLNYEVEKVSGGYISQRVMLLTLSTGVALSIGLSMARILFGIPLWMFIVPGYAAALIMVFFSRKIFVAIAFDSGGVATGPMTVTFILTMAVGVASEIPGRDPLMDGFGLIALVALAPIIAVLTLGLLYARKEQENE